MLHVLRAAGFFLASFIRILMLRGEFGVNSASKAEIQRISEFWSVILRKFNLLVWIRRILLISFRLENVSLKFSKLYYPFINFPLFRKIFRGLKQ